MFRQLYWVVARLICTVVMHYGRTFQNLSAPMFTVWTECQAQTYRWSTIVFYVSVCVCVLFQKLDLCVIKIKKNVFMWPMTQKKTQSKNHTHKASNYQIDFSINCKLKQKTTYITLHFEYFLNLLTLFFSCIFRNLFTQSR